MKVYLLAAAACVACGSSVAPGQPQRLELERWSTPQPTSHDVFLAARGDVVVMSHRISRDAGATWLPLDPRLVELARVAINDRTVAFFAASMGLARLDLISDTITPVTGAPAYATDRTWRADPTTGRFIAFDAIENAIAIEHAGGWQTSKLPQPAATETRPYIRDLESNGQTLLVASVWGIHRSVDNGTSWQLVTANAGDGRDLLVLGDQRFVLVGGATTYAFDTSGQAAGTMTSLKLGANEATVCDDGAIVAGKQVTRDLGSSWQPLFAGGDLEMVVQRAGCGGGRYWVLVISEAWGYRLVRYDAPGSPGIAAGNWEALGDQAWTSGGPPIVRTDDGTFLVAGLALAPNATSWTLHEIPARTWASGASLFGVAKQKFYTSQDGGYTWSAAATTGLDAMEPEAFAQGADGSLYVAQFTGKTVDTTDTWRSTVWRTADGGAWAIAYDATATRIQGQDVVGETHRFVGITDDGAWIATDAVSRDAGVSWKRTVVKGDRGLAHLTRSGNLVTGGAAEDLWRIYDEGGLGSLLATYTIEIDDKTIPASQLRSVAFDDEGYAYVARGMPYVQIWRSNRPLE